MENRRKLKAKVTPVLRPLLRPAVIVKTAVLPNSLQCASRGLCPLLRISRFQELQPLLPRKVHVRARLLPPIPLLPMLRFRSQSMSLAEALPSPLAPWTISQKSRYGL